MNTKKVDNLISRYSDITMKNNKIIVYVPRIREYKQKDIELDDEANKGKDPLKDELEVKEVMKTFRYKVQLGTVIVGDEDEEYKPGETVIIEMKDMKNEFDLGKKLYTVNKFQVIGKKN